MKNKKIMLSMLAAFCVTTCGVFGYAGINKVMATDGTDASVTTAAVSASADNTSSAEKTTEEEAAAETDKAEETEEAASVKMKNQYKDRDFVTEWTAADSTIITLADSGIKITGSGAAAEGQILTITKEGTYVISGSLSKGQIIVNAGDNDKVRIVLNGVNITSDKNAAIYSQNADKLIITLADKTENVLSDAENFTYSNVEKEEPDAALFSKNDLTINGTGLLTVTGNFNNGIGTKDDLLIVNGSITVNAANDTLKGKDSVTILDGNINLTAKSDGIKSSNDTDEDKGWIELQGGVYVINSNNDGIQSEAELNIFGGSYTINTDSVGAAEGSDSFKGIKANKDIYIAEGAFLIASEDDSIHSNTNATIDGGSFELTTADDGIHAEETLTVNAGDIIINESYEGIEAAVIIINDGNIDITSKDDGINAAGGNSAEEFGGRMGMGGNRNWQTDENGEIITPDGQSFTPPEGVGTMPEGGNIGNIPPENMTGEKPVPPAGGFDPAMGTGEKIAPPENIAADANAAADVAANTNANATAATTEPAEYYLEINGGFIKVNAEADGIDVNGTATINGGTIIVNGPTMSGNGALDYDKAFNINGGTLIASGASGMAMGASGTSEQASVMVYFTNTQKAGTILNVYNASGKELINFTAEKDFGCVLISSPDISVGETLKITAGESVGFDVTLSAVTTNVSDTGGAVTASGNKGGGMRGGNRTRQ